MKKKPFKNIFTFQFEPRKGITIYPAYNFYTYRYV